MTTIIYVEREGGYYFKGEINLDIPTIVKRLDEAMETRMHHRQEFDSQLWYIDPLTNLDGQWIDLLPGLTRSLHMLWLPDGQEWDAVNGWRIQSPEEDFQRTLMMIRTREKKCHEK